MKEAKSKTPSTLVLEPHAEYRAISLHPEWAWAILWAGKDVENRSWATGYRGPLLIHASSHKSSAEELESKREVIAELSGRSLDSIPTEFTRSAILGMVELLDCVSDAPSAWASDDSIHWQLRNPRRLQTPIAGVHGKLKVWRWVAVGSGTVPAARPLTSERAAQAPVVPTAAPKRDVDELDASAVISILRQVVSSTPMNDQDVYREVSRKLGFARLGSRVQKALRAHARTAVRRGVLVREGKQLRSS